MAETDRETRRAGGVTASELGPLVDSGELSFIIQDGPSNAVRCAWRLVCCRMCDASMQPGLASPSDLPRLVRPFCVGSSYSSRPFDL